MERFGRRVAVKSAVLPAELTAPIVAKDEAKRIVYGPVLIPDEPDSDGDVVGAEKIEEVAHRFLKDYGNVDVRHTLNYVGRPVESYIATQDLRFDTPDGKVVIPKGTWMLGVYVEDEGTWQRVLRGELTGFSIMAVSRAKAVKESQPKRVTLRDLGEGWVVVAVSLVDRPAVPMAKWIAIKSAPEEEPAAGLTPVQKAVAAVLGIPVGGRFSEKTLSLIRSAHDALGDLLAAGANKSQKGEHDDVNKEELTQAVKQAVESATADLKARLEAVEQAVKQQPTQTGLATGQTADQQPGQDAGTVAGGPALKELMAKLNERLEAVEKELNPGSRQPAGQDGAPGAATKSQPPSRTRDAFGRRIR